ncbi:hypothetical protein ACQ4PT_035347 [Festuca glaucescens]
MEREEIHCTHVFRILKHFGMRDMPRCCVAVRWMMQAMRPGKMVSILCREHLVLCLHIFRRPIKLLLEKSWIRYQSNREVLHVRRGLSHSTRDSKILDTKVFNDGFHSASVLTLAVFLTLAV